MPLANLSCVALYPAQPRRRIVAKMSLIALFFEPTPSASQFQNWNRLYELVIPLRTELKKVFLRTTFPCSSTGRPELVNPSADWLPL